MSAPTSEAHIPSPRTPDAQPDVTGSPSLRVRVVVLFCITFLVGAGALLALIANLQARAVLELLDDQAHSVASSIARLAYERVAANDRVGLATQLETFNQMQRIRSIAITDRQGRLFSAVGRNAAGNMTAISDRDTGPLGTPGVVTRAGPALLAGGEPRLVWVAVGEIAPIGWVRLEYDAQLLVDNRRTILLTGGGLLLTLLGLGAALLAGSMSGPLHALRRLARRIDALGETSPRGTQPPVRPEPMLPAEINALAGAVGTLDETLARMRHSHRSNLAQSLSLMDALPEALILVDTELRTVHANPAWDVMLARLSGSAAPSLKTVLTDSEQARLANAIVATATGDESVFADRLCIKCGHGLENAGEHGWLSLRGYRLLDPDGHPPRVLLHAQCHQPEPANVLTRAG